jgi:NAD(P)H-dependent FMN reductase
MTASILAFTGSVRTGSINAKLTALVVERLRAAGAAVTHLSLRDHPLPIYNGDDEAAGGVPESAIALRRQIDTHAGIFIACPEYNSGYTPLLKNSLDWASRVKNERGALTPVFGGKVVALGAVSGGARGGYRGLTQFRSMIELGMGALVLPEMVLVPNAAKGFAPDGSLADLVSAGMLEALVDRLVREAGGRG